MVKKKQKNKREPSQLGQFVARDLPNDKQVDRFDNYLKGGLDKKTINESLSEIYQGDGGQRVDLKQVNIKSRRGFWTRAGIISLYVLGIALLLGGGYYWLVSRESDSQALSLKISTPQNLVANEEFEYIIDYKNDESLSLTDLQLATVYPENFIFESSFPSPTQGNNKWDLEDLRQFGSNQVKIKGRLIAPTGSSNVILADLSYRPSNITSEFRTSTSLDTTLTSSGLDLSMVAPTSILVNQEAELVLKFKAQTKNFLDHFTVRFPVIDNLDFPETKYGTNVTTTESGVFLINKVDTAEQEIHLKFKFTDKSNDTEDLKIALEYQPQGSDQSMTFDEKLFTVEIVKNPLNLTISANGQNSDQGVDFGQTINYSISYINKGEEVMTDVIIMAVLDGEALDWRKLSDKNNGSVSGRTMAWTKNELPELASLSKNQEGQIDFSIPIRPINEASLIRNLEVRSYAQFALSGKSEDLSVENEANRSNQLIVKVNSDTSLDESARYFDQDNIAVGTGPLPLQVGQITTFKIYWKITNSLHELGDLKVTTTLPNYIDWNEKDYTNVGSISYDQSTNQVTWLIGRLPLSATTVQAEFSISLKPRTTDRNKLLILTSGTTLSATDNQTTFPVSQTLKAQTTRLEKDDIANTDGIVQ